MQAAPAASAVADAALLKSRLSIAVFALLVLSLFIGDVTKHHEKASGIPPTGAEDVSLAHLRQQDAAYARRKRKPAEAAQPATTAISSDKSP
jgi:hypothetical protein